MKGIKEDLYILSYAFSISLIAILIIKKEGKLIRTVIRSRYNSK
jgi:hypothetical protein